MKRVLFSGVLFCGLAWTVAAQEGGAVLDEEKDAAFDRIAEEVTVFTDRDFVFSSVPEPMKGKTFLFGMIDGDREIRIRKGGRLEVITPVKGVCSNVKELEGYGFKRVEEIKPYQLFGSNPFDVSAVYAKQVRDGDAYRFKKWVVFAGFSEEGLPKYQPPKVSERMARIIESWKGTAFEKHCRNVLVNRPDYLVFVPKQKLENRTPTNLRAPGDTYNDHFQVIEHNGKLFAFWTQATYEGARDQHIAFSKSLDKGETWSEPVILAGSHCWGIPGLLASWQQPMISKSGRIYCLWNQQTTSRGPHCGEMIGFYSDDDGETWSPPKQVTWGQRMDADPADPLVPPSWCNWQRPLRLGEGGKYLVGVSRHGKAPYDPRPNCKVEFLQYDNIDENPEVQDIRLKFFSTNRDALAVFNPKMGDACEEAAIVKLPDGRLFALMRSSIGHPVWSQSRDNGVTWTRPKPLLNKDGGTAYLHPRSPCPMYDWKGCEAGSGKYFALVHQTFDFNGKSEYQHRGPLYLIAGTFNPDAEQPVEFAEPKLFAPRKGGNSFYTSYTYFDGKGILWFNDQKYFLLGREIGPEWWE
ncbi:MAG: exo-alpha-sialidase [Kiritimatiellae bacterium]|nr:exo-alpha-sialidase [Kiritimatiellia bacterium]